MADFWAIREGDTLRPYGADSAAAFSKLPFGKLLRIEAKQPRNPKLNRLYWVMVHRIANAIGADSENVSDLLKIETGHCHIVKSKKYGEVRLPRSISFAEMDETAFRTFFDKCVLVIYEEWGIQRADVLDAVRDLFDPHAQIGHNSSKALVDAKDAAP